MYDRGGPAVQDLAIGPKRPSVPGIRTDSIGVLRLRRLNRSTSLSAVLPYDASWQYLGRYTFLFPLTFGAITLWLLWRRREKIRNWGFIQTALGFRSGTRKFLLGLFLVGCFLLASLWAADVGAWKLQIGSQDLGKAPWLQPEWLHSHAYIPNILAGATGFCIGAPFALVILASFTAQREEKAALDRVNRLSAAAWDTFRQLVNEFSTDERYELVVEQARHIKKYYDETRNAIGDYMSSANRLLGGPDVADLNYNMEQLKAIEPNFRNSVNALRRNINFFETQDEWAQIVGAWRVLDQYVRLQRLEQGLEWFDKKSDAGLRKWTSRNSNPLQELFDAIEVRLYSPNMTLNVDTMANALDTLATYANMDDSAHLGEWLLDQGNIFTPDRSSIYHAKRDAAQLFILDLKRYIALVEMSYWPRSQTMPIRETTEYQQTAHEFLGSLQTPEGRENLDRAFRQIIAKRNREQRRQRLNRILWGVSPSPPAD